MNHSNILDESLLAECEKSAQESAKYAEDALTKIYSIIDEYKIEINTVINDIVTKNYQISTHPIIQDIKNASKDVEEYSEKELGQIQNYINVRCLEMEKFNIVVFGKTTVGKSTLIEILTNGDGSSIGEGAQGTTKDVSHYEWNGLSISDVPGFSAAYRKEDERIAFDEVRKGDLVLFLLDNNKASPEEAAALARLKDLGKPIFGIMNVKVTTNRPDKILKRDIEMAFRSQDIPDIISQFYEFGQKSHNQDWHNIDFLTVHLKCAFEAMHTDDIQKKKLYNELSNFDALTEKLIDYIKQRGKILRQKTFIDIIEKQLKKIIDTIYESEYRLRENHKTFSNERFEFKEKCRNFKLRANDKFDLLKKRLRSKVHVSLDNFVDANYEKDNSTINDNFKKFISGLNIIDEVNKTNKEIIEDYNLILKNESKMINNSYVFRSPSTDNLKFSGGELIDVKKWTNRIGGFGIGGPIIMGLRAANIVKNVTPIGWGITALQFGIFLGGKFFADDIDVKRKKRKKELVEEIMPILDKIINLELEKTNNLIKETSKKIDQINERNYIIDNMMSRIITIHSSDVLSRLKMIESHLNGYIIKTVLNERFNYIRKIERDIGISITLYTEKGHNLIGRDISLLEDLLQEKIVVIGGE